MAKTSGGSEDVFNVDRIRRLIDLMKEYDLSEVDLRQSEQQIRLVRGGTAPVVAAPVVQPVAAAPVAAAAAPAAPAAEAADGPHIQVIKSPMVGTFYTKANPKSDAFVQVGSAVTPETMVCIIEAMKVFNEIPAEVRGKIVAVLVENEQPVDFGRPLFKVDTCG
jgi:acetyl-CoA carboxylase biotin carboxyl carrier protein